ncbi:DUF1206 domain-containing protein [Maribacter sp. PR1]|uniref:DUF1206 domain-containing protein n=1 Tax=Maribacter cobaltidurans TaxID=1178778 RepID=A0ABU7IS41_9FLAO|nr:MULTISPECIES: DUF1206 domain-containing protein [Maribacter]MDC6388386.1 DUF1206 domain-containing protein [Maribacter sp. PR1]MEE1975775.1 DUF1206 domain-containing protein [Maribacter cobaltidurans]
MDDKIKKAAKTGFAAKGVVYLITGVLAFMAAFNLGGQKAGKLEVIDFLENQPFGKFILVALGLGLCCYALWRFIQSIQDPENIGDDSKGAVKRISFFISGLIYMGLGFFAILNAFSQSGSGGGSKSSMIPSEYQQYIFLAVGICLAGKSIYQFIKAYKGKFISKFNLKAMSDSKKRKFIKNMGYAGLTARGILVGIVAYFFVTAGLSIGGSASSGMQGTSGAFSFLQQNSSGPWLMGLVAAGLACYGVYMFTMSKYRSFN